MYIRQQLIDRCGKKFLPMRRKLATYGQPGNFTFDPYAEKRYKLSAKLKKKLVYYNRLIDAQMADRKRIGKKEITPAIYWEA